MYKIFVVILIVFYLFIYFTLHNLFNWDCCITDINMNKIAIMYLGDVKH